MNTPIIGVTDPQLSFDTNPPSPDELARWILSEPESYSSNPLYYYKSSYRWRLIVPRQEIEARIGRDIGEILSITTRGRGMSGRVEEVLVKGTKGFETIKGDPIRSRLGGLRSNLFIIMPKFGKDEYPETFIFAGAGWGHGVGMCQTGAAGMAHEGFKAEEILKHYYPLGELTCEY
jgi:SpoIID/LytB domain protein